jgi:transcriptional regulator with XRE-family HTH domain
MAKPKRAVDQPPGDPGELLEEKDAELVVFGGRLLELRKAAGMTQEALAHAADLHWSYVGQIERGERNLTYKNILKLSRGLGLEPAELMPPG